MASRQPLISEVSRRRKLRLLLRHLSPGALVLEIGAGDGWFSAQLRGHGHVVTTIDLAAPADIIGDVNRWRDLGLREHSFDAVVALEVIEHVDCWESMKSLCKVGGKLMLSSPHPRWDWVMRVLERLRLTQRRTSPHVNLTDFRKLDAEVLVLRRPLGIHQVGVFVNRPRAR